MCTLKLVEYKNSLKGFVNTAAPKDILFDSSVFLGLGFIIQTISIKKRSYFKIPCSNDPKYFMWKLLKFLFL